LVQVPVEKIDYAYFKRQSMITRWQVNEHFFFNVTNVTTGCGVLSYF
jgi:hypothetical protein